MGHPHALRMLLVKNQHPHQQGRTVILFSLLIHESHLLVLYPFLISLYLLYILNNLNQQFNLNMNFKIRISKGKIT